MFDPRLTALVKQTALVGSTAAYGVGADEDYAVLVANLQSYLTELDGEGWRTDGQRYPGTEFTSVRKGNVNLLVTDKEWVYLSYVAGGCAMKSLVPLVPAEDKATRVAIYESIRSVLRNAYGQ